MAQLDDLKINDRMVSNFISKYKINDETGCWEWTASIMNSGYGQFLPTNGVCVSAHRFSWVLHNGKICDGLYVLHKCDNKICVNPEHLFLGTAHDNLVDAVKKGRHKPANVKGTRNGSAKLSDDDVLYIRKNFVPRTNGNAKELAKLFGVNSVTIRSIVNKFSWKHIL